MFVSDQIVLDLVLNIASNIENYEGVVLDGIPRTIAQLDMLQEKMDFSQSYVLNCILREDVNIEKLMGRRICSGCGQGYNICSIDRDNYLMPPMNSKNGANCDNCGD